MRRSGADHEEVGLVLRLGDGERERAVRVGYGFILRVCGDGGLHQRFGLLSRRKRTVGTAEIMRVGVCHAVADGLARDAVRRFGGEPLDDDCGVVKDGGGASG